MNKGFSTLRGLASPRVLVSSALVGLVVALAGSVGLGSAATGAVQASAPVNTSLPTIVGSPAKQGATVAVSTGVWSGTTPLVFSYQWQQCDSAGAACSPIADATGQTYAPGANDIGQTLRAVVTATNTAGSSSATTAASDRVVSAAQSAPLNTSPPAVTGSARQGEALSASSGSWNGATPITFAYQWQRCDATGGSCVSIVGGTGATYTLVTADVGETLRILVLATNSAGANLGLSAQTALVTAASGPANTAPPSITGSATQGSTLTISTGSWTGASPITFTYQWLRCDAGGGGCSSIRGAAKQTYTLGSSDAGHTLRALVTATNPVGVASLLTGPTGVVSAPSRPVNTALPGISGSARQGALLTVVRGTWTGSSPITVAYQWLRCDSNGNGCGNIQNANSSTYRLGLSDVNRTLRVVATASNSVGRSTVVSGRTNLVQPSVPVNTALPTVTGTARQGSTLLANPGNWESYTAVRFTYQWTRCNVDGQSCRPIPGQIGTTRRTYTLVAADVGRRIFVQIKASNSVGPNFVNSLPTAVVTASTSPPPPPPLAGGTAIPVSSVTAPDRLQVDQVRFTPGQIRSGSQPLVAQVHVIETARHKAVSGAYVYAVGVPFDRLSGQHEVVTDRNGWATITFRILPTFQLRHGNLVVVFVRARKPGEDPLGGISTRRLVSVRVA